MLFIKHKSIHLLQWTLTDEEDPVLVCPEDRIDVVPDGQLNATITWPEPSVMDNSGEVLTAVASMENSSTVPVGEAITIYYNATDMAGNTGYCNFTVTVIGRSMTSIVWYIRN